MKVGEIAAKVSHMVFKDLRAFLDCAEKMNDLQKIDGAHWNLEIGTLTELMAEIKGPLPVFDNIPGYSKGYRIAANLYLTKRRTALALDIPADSPPMEIIKIWRSTMGNRQPIKPKEVANGPVLENVLEGNRVNLLKFPTPKWHELDGGRYLGTGCVVVTRDPDEGWVNAAPYRIEVHSETLAGILTDPPRHGRLMMRKYWGKGNSCPVAIAIGVEPALFIASFMNIKWGYSEYDLAGSIKNEPVEVLTLENTGLPVPATSEIVIEGEIPPPEVETHPEGPFGEYIGYYASGTRPETVVRVKRILHRNDPIIHGEPPLKPPFGHHIGVPLHYAPVLWDNLEALGIPGIQGVYTHPAGGGGQLAVVSIKQAYPGHSKLAAMALTASLRSVARFIVVVDDDIDITDLSQVVWAACSRCDPETGIDVVRGCPTNALDPRLPPEKRSIDNFTNSRAIINACRPYEWIKQFPPVNTASPEIRKRIMDKWQTLFASIAARKQ